MTGTENVMGTEATGLRDKIDACTDVVMRLTSEVRTIRASNMAKGGLWLIEQGIRRKTAECRKKGGSLCGVRCC